MKKRPTVLILDDDELVIQSLGKALQNLGYGVILCLNPREALDRIENSEVDLVVSDLRMPAMNGIEFLEKIQAKCPNAARVLMIGPEDREIAAAAISREAADWFLGKPWEEEVIRLTLLMILRLQRIVCENRELQSRLREQEAGQENAFIT